MPKVTQCKVANGYVWYIAPNIYRHTRDASPCIVRRGGCEQDLDIYLSHIRLLITAGAGGAVVEVTYIWHMELSGHSLLMQMQWHAEGQPAGKFRKKREKYAAFALSKPKGDGDGHGPDAEHRRRICQSTVHCYLSENGSERKARPSRTWLSTTKKKTSVSVLMIFP